MDNHAPAPVRHDGLGSTRGSRQMKLTLELDNGETNTINMEGEPDNRLQSLQGMCILLDMWATERDKNNGQ
jgi:hypothetical protein